MSNVIVYHIALITVCDFANWRQKFENEALHSTTWWPQRSLRLPIPNSSRQLCIMFNISNKCHKLSVGCLTKTFWASDLDGNFPTLHYTKISQCKTHLTPSLTSAHAQMLGSVALLPWWWLTSCVTAMSLCNGWILTCCLLFPLVPSMWKSTS